MNTNFYYKITLFLAFSVLFCISCGNENTGDVQLKNRQGTDQMVRELKAIAYDSSNINIWHLNRLRAKSIDEQIRTNPEIAKLIGLYFNSSVEWLNAGEFQRSIDRNNTLLKIIESRKIRLPEEAYYEIKEVLGMAHFRKAEIENCIQNHNEYSCIFPIDKRGQHVKREDAQKAKEIFRELLQLPNAKLRTKWLYNAVHMALGQYPDYVEKKYLLEESLFDSDVDFPRFKEVGMSLGIAVNDISGSIVMDDFNNDGYLDMMVSSYGLDDQLRYFQNDHKGGFKDLTAESGLMGLWSGLNMVQADYNNDGWLDVLVLRGAWLGKSGNHPNSLLRNNGDGTFSDVTKESGLYCHFPTQSASWADFNNDGWIDVFIGNEHSKSMNAPCQLFQNNGDGTFSDVAPDKGLALNEFVKGCIWGDYDNDGNPDLYISSINNHNFLFRNGGKANNFKFFNESQKSNTQEPRYSFPCWFFDYNQDGWEDIFVSGFDFSQFKSAAGEVLKDYTKIKTDAELPRLYKNNQDGTFTEVSKKLDVNHVLYTMGCNFGDLNNDGMPDFYAATGTPDFRALIPNRMFLNNDGERFLDVTTSGGFGHLQKGHGVAFGDIDNDGDQDVYTVLGGSYDGDNFMNALFLNPGNDNNWIKLKLIGTSCNKAAIGAKVKIVGTNSAGKEKVFFNRVNSGGSFGANPLLIEQGLKDILRIDRLEIIWPNGKISQTFEGVSMNRYYRITQGDSNLDEVDAPKVQLHLHHHH